MTQWRQSTWRKTFSIACTCDTAHHDHESQSHWDLAAESSRNRWVSRWAGSCVLVLAIKESLPPGRLPCLVLFLANTTPYLWCAICFKNTKTGKSTSIAILLCLISCSYKGWSTLDQANPPAGWRDSINLTSILLCLIGAQIQGAVKRKTCTH